VDWGSPRGRRRSAALFEDFEKPLFFGTVNPEKMINRIFYLNNPPNDPSTSEYSLKRRFNFKE
jgi:hypothetical protein